MFGAKQKPLRWTAPMSVFHVPSRSASDHPRSAGTLGRLCEHVDGFPTRALAMKSSSAWNVSSMSGTRRGRARGAGRVAGTPRHPHRRGLAILPAQSPPDALRRHAGPAFAHWLRRRRGRPCKILVTQRLKRSGMRRRHTGGQGFLTLHALVQSSRLDQAWALLPDAYRQDVIGPNNVVAFPRTPAA